MIIREQFKLDRPVWHKLRNFVFPGSNKSTLFYLIFLMCVIW